MTNEALDRAIAACELEEYAAVIRASAMPCVYLRLGQACDAGDPGSRIGGLPRLASGVAWPASARGDLLSFALQLDLRDVPPFEGVALPREGLLSFFFEPLELGQTCRVVLSHGSELEARALPAAVAARADDLTRVAPHRVRLEPGLGVPGWYCEEYDAIVEPMDDASATRFAEDLRWKLQGEGTCIGRLFGHVEGIGNDPRYYAQRDVDGGTAGYHDLAGFRYWRHVLTLDSCRALDLTLGDAGYHIVLVRETALAAGDFSDVYGSLESS